MFQRICQLKYLARTIKPDETVNYYPNSWYPVLESQSLNCNEVKAIQVFEKDLIVFRGMSGKAHVLDAYCPHLGAHLAVGGTVVGEHIRCPFHGWTFDGNGVCTEVPGLESIFYSINLLTIELFNVLSFILGSKLPKAAIKVWKSCELNGFIYIWYHSRGEDTDWYPMKIPELVSKVLLLRGRTEHMMYGHVQVLYHFICIL